MEIGPPSALEGWFARVWPNVNQLVTICSGPFATVLPKVCRYVFSDDRVRLRAPVQVRSILGPSIAIRVPGYGSSEAAIGVAHDGDKLDEFVLQSDDIIEFLDVTQDATHVNLRQAVRIGPPPDRKSQLISMMA